MRHPHRSGNRFNTNNLEGFTGDDAVAGTVIATDNPIHPGDTVRPRPVLEMILVPGIVGLLLEMIESHARIAAIWLPARSR